jgi:hypothetical protein
MILTGPEFGYCRNAFIGQTDKKTQALGHAEWRKRSTARRIWRLKVYFVGSEDGRLAVWDIVLVAWNCLSQFNMA